MVVMLVVSTLVDDMVLVCIMSNDKVSLIGGAPCKLEQKNEWLWKSTLFKVCTYIHAIHIMIP